MAHAFQARGIRLRLLDWGEGSPHALVLVHGLTSSAHTWDPFARQVCDLFRVVAPDLRGHGESGHTPEDYGMDRFVEDLGDLARFLNLATFDLVGHSLGALVALAFAAAHPHSVRRLVLEEGGPGLDREAARQSSGYLFTRPLGFESLEEARAWFQEHNPHQPEEWLDQRVQHSLRQNWAGRWVLRHDAELYWLLAPGDAAQQEREGWETAARLSCPLLVVRGQESPLFSGEAARRLASAAPEGKLVEIPGAGHSPHAAALEAFLDAVVGFLGEA